MKTSLVKLGLRPFGAYKSGFHVIFFYFNIHGKLYILRNNYTPQKSIALTKKIKNDIFQKIIMISFLVAKLLFKSLWLSVHQSVSNTTGKIQNRRLLSFVKIPYTNKHSVCNLLRLSICQSCYKIKILKNMKI